MAERATIVELTDDHVDDAAGLLAERHRAQRVVEPGLDPAYEDLAAARAEIAAVRKRESASEVAAVAGGRSRTSTTSGARCSSRSATAR